SFHGPLPPSSVTSPARESVCRREPKIGTLRFTFPGYWSACSAVRQPTPLRKPRIGVYANGARNASSVLNDFAGSCFGRSKQEHRPTEFSAFCLVRAYSSGSRQSAFQVLSVKTGQRLQPIKDVARTT